MCNSILCCTLTPSLPQPVKFPGWKMHGHACKQYIFRSCNVYFQCYEFWWKSFQCEKGQTCWRLSNFPVLLIVFKWNRCSEGVNVTIVSTILSKDKFVSRQKQVFSTVYSACLLVSLTFIINVITFITTTTTITIPPPTPLPLPPSSWSWSWSLSSFHVS